MKEHPILFSGEMVRAILDGRKTQTRRVLRHRESVGLHAEILGIDAYGYAPGLYVRPHVGNDVASWMGNIVYCPFGTPGDRLWVREAYGVATGHMYDGAAAVRYFADGTTHAINDERSNDLARSMSSGRRRPSIHMPRWASRLTLEVVSVRVERLQDITEADAEAEGLERNSDIDPMGSGLYSSAREEFAQLWNDINGKRAPWQSNPWVWVVTFKPL